MQSALDEVGGIADGELVSRLERLVRADRAVGVKLLVHLGEVDSRGLYREHAYSSMFAYCLGALRMSDGEAGLRVLAARVIRRFPVVVERFESGAVNLTGIKLIAPLLTAENHVQLLDRVRGMSKREIEVLVADLAPKPDVPARVRKVPERRPAQSDTGATNLAACNMATASTTATMATASTTATMAAASTTATMAAANTAAMAAPSARCFRLPLHFAARPFRLVVQRHQRSLWRRVQPCS